MSLYYLILYVFSFFLSVRCCISSGNSGCSSPAATLGGRLVFTGKSGQDIAEPPSRIAGRKLVFIKEKTYFNKDFPLRRTAGLGRGRIWSSKRGCRDGFCQHNFVDSTRTLPCFADLLDASTRNNTTISPEHKRIQDLQDYIDKTSIKVSVVVEVTEPKASPSRPRPRPRSRPANRQNVIQNIVCAGNMSMQFSDVTPTSINVSWSSWDQTTDLGSGPISGYQIQFKEAQETDFRKIPVGMSLSYLFENLTEDTVYEFRVVIFRDHSNGEGPSSPKQTFKTPCGVHEEDVTLNLTTPTWRRGELLVAKWQIAERKSSCGTINKTLIVEMKELERCPVDPPEKFNLRDVESNTKILRHRKPNSMYKVTLAVAYDGGEFYNKSKEIRTLDTEPTLPPENLRVDVTRKDMLKFQWTKPPCEGRNGEIINYHTSFTINGHERKDTTVKTSKTFFGLKEGDVYTFKVKAETRYGRGPYTEPGCKSVFGIDTCLGSTNVRPY